MDSGTVMREIEIIVSIAAGNATHQALDAYSSVEMSRGTHDVTDANIWAVTTDATRSALDAAIERATDNKTQYSFEFASRVMVDRETIDPRRAVFFALSRDVLYATMNKLLWRMGEGHDL